MRTPSGPVEPGTLRPRLITHKALDGLTERVNRVIWDMLRHPGWQPGAQPLGCEGFSRRVCGHNSVHESIGTHALSSELWSGPTHTDVDDCDGSSSRIVHQ
jgi:hypothetical protein